MKAMAMCRHTFARSPHRRASDAETHRDEHLKLSCEIRRHNHEGDTLFIHGSVTGKYASNGKTYVELALVAENRDGELSARSTAVALLPNRSG